MSLFYQCRLKQDMFYSLHQSVIAFVTGAGDPGYDEFREFAGRVRETRSEKVLRPAAIGRFDPSHRKEP